MANLNIGKVVMTFNQNPYISSTTYPFLEAVYDIPTNTTYLSLLDNNTGVLPVYPVIVNQYWIVLCKGIGVTTDNNFTNTYKSKLDGIATLADVTDANNVGIAINGSTAKTIPVDADTVGLIDSVNSNVLSKLSWSNIKTTLKSYFDTLYNLYVHPTGDGNHHVPATSTTNSGKILKAGTTAGSESWGTLADIGAALGDATGNATNALSLGGNLASLYPLVTTSPWLPTLYGTTVAGTVSYFIQSGTLYKIGKLAYVKFKITATLSGATGALKIGGLPIVPNSTASYEFGFNSIVTAPSYEIKGWSEAYENSIGVVTRNAGTTILVTANTVSSIAIYGGYGVYLVD